MSSVARVRAWTDERGASPLTGLRVRSALDTNAYPAGIRVPDADMDTLHLRPDAFHGEWNYSLLPRLMLPLTERAYFVAVPNVTMDASCASAGGRSW